MIHVCQCPSKPDYFPFRKKLNSHFQHSTLKASPSNIIIILKISFQHAVSLWFIKILIVTTHVLYSSDQCMSQNSKGTCDDLFIKLLYHFVKSIKLTQENNKVQFPRDTETKVLFLFIFNFFSTQTLKFKVNLNPSSRKY